MSPEIVASHHLNAMEDVVLEFKADALLHLAYSISARRLAVLSFMISWISEGLIGAVSVREEMKIFSEWVRSVISTVSVVFSRRPSLAARSASVFPQMPMCAFTLRMVVFAGRVLTAEIHLRRMISSLWLGNVVGSRSPLRIAVMAVRQSLATWMGELRSCELVSYHQDYCRKTN